MSSFTGHIKYRNNHELNMSATKCYKTEEMSRSESKSYLSVVIIYQHSQLRLNCCN